MKTQCLNYNLWIFSRLYLLDCAYANFLHRLVIYFPTVAGNWCHTHFFSKSQANCRFNSVLRSNGSQNVLVDGQGDIIQEGAKAAGPVCWSESGEPLQLTVASNELVLCDAFTGNTVRHFPFPESTPTHPAEGLMVALTSDGDHVAAGIGAKGYVWVSTRPPVHVDLPLPATALELSPDGSLLGIGCEDGVTHVYAIPSGGEVAALPSALRGSPITCLAFTRDRLVRHGYQPRTNSWLLAIGDQGAGIVIWDLQRKVPRSFCRGSTWTVASLAFSPDGSTLASAGRNGPRLWDVTTGRPLLELPAVGSGETVSLALDSSGTKLAYASLAGAGQPGVALLNLEADRGIHDLRGLASPVRKLWFSRSSDRIAALSDDWHLGVWDARRNELLFIFEAPVGTYADNAGGQFDPSGQNFAFSTAHEALLYDLRSGGIVQHWKLRRGVSDTLQWDETGRLLLLRREYISEQRPSAWRLYSLGSGIEPKLLHEQTETNWMVRDVAFAQGGKCFIAWSGAPERVAHAIRVYDTGTGRELWKTQTERDNDDLGVFFDPNGAILGYTAWRSNDTRARLVRLADFQQIGIAKPEIQAIGPPGSGFAGNGWLFPDNSMDHSHRIPLLLPYGYSVLPVFSPNGKFLGWGTGDGTVHVADLERVKKRLGPVLDFSWR